MKEDKLKPDDVDAPMRKRCCCNCGRNIRIPNQGIIECYCKMDAHRIGYVESFTGWCRRWKGAGKKEPRQRVRR